MAEEFTGPVDIDGFLAQPGRLRVNGPTVAAPMGQGPFAKVADNVGRGEIECGHLFAHGNGPHPAANFGSHVGVDGNVDVSGNLTVIGDIVNGKLEERIAALEAHVVRLGRQLWVSDGRSVGNVAMTTEARVVQLEHDTKPWYKGGRLIN